MEIRNTVPEDINAILEIYEKARDYMKKSGNPDQWGDGYPEIEIITKDIKNKNSYVCIDEDQIVGTFCFFKGEDSTYKTIYEGKWMNDEPYGVVHRIASLSLKKGVATYCLQWCFNQISNIRIDTHRDNYIMQGLLQKNGFQKCGIIYLFNGAERLAYQKITQKKRNSLTEVIN